MKKAYYYNLRNGGVYTKKQVKQSLYPKKCFMFLGHFNNNIAANFAANDYICALLDNAQRKGVY